ncbi:MAG: DUF5916 domain-containing protein, partial [Gemmatimonadaceae bacterium]
MHPPLLHLVVAALAAAPTPKPGPVYNGRDHQLIVHIPRFQADAVIDGELNEPEWQAAAMLTGFSEFSPQDGIAASDSTQVLMWYSPSALYIGIRAFETDGAVHATLANRDSISADDNVQILLGTFHDKHRAYLFAVNPLGVQMDGTIVEQGQAQTSGWTPTLSGRAAPDLSQDFVYASKGHLTSYGYQVEVKIPFKSIKYQAADTQNWAINIVRDVQHSGFEDSWVPARRADASFLSQSGTLEGLTRLNRGLALDLNPVVTEKVTGAAQPNGWAYARATPQPGGNIRWGMTNNLTVNATIKPDFAEVESDAEQVVIDPRDALYFPEKRPFFLDGLDQFSVPNNLIYTRRIIAPDGALKLTGQVAGTSIGLLSAIDAPDTSTTARDRTLYNIFRAQRDFANQSQIGMAYTDREVGTASNRMADLDGQVLFGQVYNASFQAAESFNHPAGTSAVSAAP